MLKGKKILIGVTSGIAIYKVLSLISSLRKKGAIVEVIMTEAATKFINPITFETMSNNKVYTDMWVHPDKVLHIDITNDVDLFLVAPATANTIAKVNAGIADNLLTTAILASKAPVAFAVSTNTNMLLNPITQRNIESLQELGYDFIDSNEGQLACNTVGKGRMAEPSEIEDYIEYKLTRKDLLGKKIIVASGPSVSKMDPVRYITNYSSGKTGYAIAKNARNRGAEVIYLTGKVKTPELSMVKNIKFETNEDLKEAIGNHFESADSLIMAAAPVDYVFETTAKQKIKKSEDTVNYTLKKSEDIVGFFGNKKTNQKIIAFAAETQNLIENARKKLKSKHADIIVANDITQDGAGFDVDTNIVTIISEDNMIKLDKMAKNEVANKILDELVK
ncbi:bifunctional phosphopantothenoylcysteine decarboxylase/phosphopantothenate--cysteine ligase CoaBC [Helcococcus kunzii]|uniref:bifunctional phosphopantothenoylcysteine decarboxylase/phosphopantothenate--cysteine ligase CoaBC n=1 Tax=Helcococcus kunzii TaxID=40091 RepID=UPI001BB08979|nr:bifunctional phosphopantothenoylcysteine decarboxylase/phosphopantothenate--cysteine ligase CoaBC [Helcococcus kunzii]QUY64768.1 bifunctional phosphopantothenoylcysteine decarboxylase/phosphopantothenate--cysteine ligase CoaBC [Helcococcus kunzii]